MSQSSSRKETEHAICSFRMSEIGKEEPRPLCFLSADIFAEQKDGIVICVTNAAEAWSGDCEYQLEKTTVLAFVRVVLATRRHLTLLTVCVSSYTM